MMGGQVIGSLLSRKGIQHPMMLWNGLADYVPGETATVGVLTPRQTQLSDSTYNKIRQGEDEAGRLDASGIPLELGASPAETEAVMVSATFGKNNSSNTPAP